MHKLIDTLVLILLLLGPAIVLSAVRQENPSIHEKTTVRSKVIPVQNVVDLASFTLMPSSSKVL